MIKPEDSCHLTGIEVEQLIFDQNGLIPAVIQDYRNGAVLMLGYMNREAVRRTMTEGRVCFWSRSRQVYWVKGETSGNYLLVKTIHADCDCDALLVNVTLQGPGKTCHTGRYSCFFNPITGYSNSDLNFHQTAGIHLKENDKSGLKND